MYHRATSLYVQAKDLKRRTRIQTPQDEAIYQLYHGGHICFRRTRYGVRVANQVLITLNSSAISEAPYMGGLGELIPEPDDIGYIGVGVAVF